MAPEATYLRDECERRLTAAAAIAAGEVYQMGDGKAGVKTGLNAAASGDRANFTTEGIFTVAKTTGVVIIDGGRVYWDHSANTATFRKVNDSDFYIGRAIGDSASADTTLVVDLNSDPPYDIDLNHDPFASVLVGTAAAGGFCYPVKLGGACRMELTATNEAQKVDLLSVDGFAPGAKAIISGAFRVEADGGAVSNVDVSLGVASATHASDADAIAESAFIHLDQNDTKIYCESDDGTTEVAATDSTKTYTEGATKACQVEFWIDLRDLTAVKFYINGVRVLTSTAFKLDAATGPLFLLAHLEKASSTDVYKLHVDWLRARLTQQ